MNAFGLNGFWRLAGLVVALVIGMTGMAQAAGWYEPARGSAERKAILDAVRPVIEAQMDGPVEFVIRDLRVEDGWAFLVADPQRPGGGAIDPRSTRFGEDASFMDGLTVYALVLWANERWHLADHVVGPTDVAFEPWPQLYGAPLGIFGF